jgi:hypothetical protein
MPGLTGQIILWIIVGDWRKVIFNGQHRCSFKMAAILDWFLLIF